MEQTPAFPPLIPLRGGQEGFIKMNLKPYSPLLVERSPARAGEYDSKKIALFSLPVA